MPEDCVRIDPEVWAQIAGFIERREEIRATYQTFDGRISEYTLRPYHLLAYHGNWYVFAWNATKERVATFAISRFRQIEPTGARFAPPTDFDPKAYAKNFPVYHEERVDVTRAFRGHIETAVVVPAELGNIVLSRNLLCAL